MRTHRFDFPDLPLRAFQHVGDYRIKLYGGGNPIEDFVGGVGDVVGGVGDVVGDVVGGAVNAVSDAGSSIDDFVNDEIPGGWGTVAAATALAAGIPMTGSEGAAASGVAGDLAAADAVYAGATTPAWEASLANALPASGAVAAPVAESVLSSTPLGPLEAGGIADLTAGLPSAAEGAIGAGVSDVAALPEAGGIADLTAGVPDYGVGADLGEGIAADYTAPAAGVSSTGVPLDVPNFGPGADLGEGLAADYVAPAAGATGITALGDGVPQDVQNFGVGADMGEGIAAGAAGAAAGAGLGTLAGALATPLLGGLTGGGALLGAAGLYKLIDMMKEDNKRFGTPGRSDYTGGALSKFKYDPSSFTPTTADPNRFRPTTVPTLNQAMYAPAQMPAPAPAPVDQRGIMASARDLKKQVDDMNLDDQFKSLFGGLGGLGFASGGKTQKPQLTSKAKLAALDPYLRAVAEVNNNAYAARMPQAMQMPAGNISQLGQFAAGGGVSNLGDYSDGGRLLRGPGDGVSDSIPAVIGNKQPARLADGEFVVPARIVSELGNGSTEAGARKLYAMMDRIQNARGKTTGKGKVAKDTKADKHLPA